MKGRNRTRGGLLLALFATAWALLGPPAVSGPSDEIRVLPRPPFQYFYPGKKPRSAPALRLLKMSEQRNAITDEEAWFARNRLALPTFGSDLQARRRGKIPDWAPEFFAGQGLVRAIDGGRHVLLLYGPDFSGGHVLVSFDKATGRQRYALDFRNYLRPPFFPPEERTFVEETVQWAQEAGGVLYVSNFHSTYAKSSRGRNGYITALDPNTGRLLWRSRPLVSNTRNFVVRGDAIITGYGFTAEPDYLYVLDRRTGGVARTVKLRSGPEYLIPKDGRLYVRTYNTDYVFRLQP